MVEHLNLSSAFFLTSLPRFLYLPVSYRHALIKNVDENDGTRLMR